MHVTDELLDKIAYLARLDLSGQERNALKADFQQMLDFVSTLQEIEVTNTEPLIHPGATRTTPAQDRPEPPLSVDEALKNAPGRHDDFFRVPNIKP